MIPSRLFWWRQGSRSDGAWEKPCSWCSAPRRWFPNFHFGGIGLPTRVLFLWFNFPVNLFWDVDCVYLPLGKTSKRSMFRGRVAIGIRMETQGVLGRDLHKLNLLVQINLDGKWRSFSEPFGSASCPCFLYCKLAAWSFISFFKKMDFSDWKERRGKWVWLLGHCRDTQPHRRGWEVYSNSCICKRHIMKWFRRGNASKVCSRLIFLTW